VTDNRSFRAASHKESLDSTPIDEISASYDRVATAYIAHIASRSAKRTLGSRRSAVLRGKQRAVRLLVLLYRHVTCTW
jgi:hypothetical protein